MQKNKKRPDGRVKSKVYLGVVDGKPKYKYVYAKNNRDLEKKIQEVKIALGKGLDLTANRDTFGYWAEQWATLKDAEVCASRAAAYRKRCDNLSDLNNLEITKIRTTDIQSIITRLSTEKNKGTGKPYSKYTLSEIRNVCSQIFKLAIDNRVLDYNPAPAVKIPKAARKAEKRRALTKEEQSWVINFPHRAQTAAMIMMFAGLRRGELMALTWADIDLDEKTITVNKSVEVNKGKSYIKEGGKSDAATRVVYMPNILVKYLEDVPGAHFGFVVTKEDGSMITESSWKSLWNSYIDDLNLEYGNWESCIVTKGKRPSKFEPDKSKKPMLIPRFTAHWLRHTFITLMYLAGVDILTAKEQAGHKDIETTMSIYTHLDEQHKKKNIEKLNNYVNSNVSSIETSAKEDESSAI